MKKISEAERDTWSNIWCILRSINWWDIEGKGGLDYDTDWLLFCDDPHGFLIRADDRKAAAIWAAVEKRMK